MAIELELTAGSYVKYEANRKKYGKKFLDENYICCSSYGKPRSKDYHWSHYKELLKSLGLPDIRWHDLRSTYTTLLLKEDFSPKAITKLAGHAKEIITMDIYGDNRNIIPEEIPELTAYMKEVLPRKADVGSVVEEIIKIDVGAYLPYKI